MKFQRLLMSMVAAASLWLPLPANGFVYRADAIEGWVVEAETGKPIEGVIVVAYWMLEGGWGGGTPINALRIYEAVTDDKGRYYFPSWGPRFALQGDLGSRSPALLYFKHGYKYLALGNELYRGVDTTRSDWDKKTVKLERFKGTLEQYARDHLPRLSDELWIVGFSVGRHSGDYCGWESFPRMLKALDAQEAEFRRAGLVQGTVVSRLRAGDAELRAAGCGTVDELIKK